VWVETAFQGCDAPFEPPIFGRGHKVKKPRRAVSKISAGLATLSVLTILCLVSFPVGAAILAGTPEQVQSAVGGSAKVTAINSETKKELTNLRMLTGALAFPKIRPACITTTQCVFGDLASKESMVLFGDSHAMMWLPAVTPWATSHHYRLVLLWNSACPIVELPHSYVYLGVNSLSQETSVASCTRFRKQALTQIEILNPSIVLVGERTSSIVEGRSLSGTNLFPASEWTTALVRTLNLLKAPHRKVALIEDIPALNHVQPTCLSQNPNSIQRCASPFPNTLRSAGGSKLIGQQPSERAATTKTKTGFISTIAWFCSQKGTRVEPVINNLVTYYDWSHVSYPYALWLSGVMGLAISAATT
jgi:hypothetical protein